MITTEFIGLIDGFNVEAVYRDGELIGYNRSSVAEDSE